MTKNPPHNRLPDDFDAETYLSLHSDVRVAGVNAAEHYLTFGIAEGRGYRSLSQTRQTYLSRIAGLENFSFLLSRMPTYTAPPLALSPNVTGIDDAELIGRVTSAYRTSLEAYSPTDGFWDSWHFGLKKTIHDALAGDDRAVAAGVLRDPASNVFFWGFDAIAKSPEGSPEPHELVLTRLNTSCDWRDLYAYWICDSLIGFAEMVGARRAVYPEYEVDRDLQTFEKILDTDELLTDIEVELGLELHFPNPFPSELGIASKRGLIGFRSVQALYQGWRIATIAKGRQNFKVLEIGAGLGRTAYFANLFGVNDYTIVDLPLTNAAQGYFLGRVLGADNVRLGGETGTAAIRVMVNADMAGHDETYDLVVNVDSLTEMPREVAKDYWSFIRSRSDSFLSINHEFNLHTVRELYRDDSTVFATRYPYPLRRGYVEELLTLA